MTSWCDTPDDTPEAAADRARVELAAQWMLRSGPPTLDHYRAVMDARAAAELVDVNPANDRSNSDDVSRTTAPTALHTHAPDLATTPPYPG